MSFLKTITSHLFEHHQKNLGECTVVFPNKRAGLFLKKEISKQIDQPVWSPQILSLEDFLLSFSNIHKSDTLNLVFELFGAYSTYQQKNEGFESFYFWGEMLLRDFEEVDHYLVKPDQLFHHIKSDLQLTKDFYFLEEEQEKIIQRFWQDFFPNATKSQTQFIDTWQILASVYSDFKQRLTEKQLGYPSSIYRELYENNLKELELNTPLIFAGFSGLTPVEEKIIKHFVKNGAEILWDVDKYYMDDKDQEAGVFLRAYKSDPVLGKSFRELSETKINKNKVVIATGVSLELGQAKWVGEQVEKLLNRQIKPEEIAIVLPQDHMLFPVLNALPDNLDKINITMGYPLKDTPLYGLLEAALEVQEYVQVSTDLKRTYYHKPTIDVLTHPYIFKSEKSEIDNLIQFIHEKNQIRVDEEKLRSLALTEVSAIFRELRKDENLATYLLEIITVLSTQVQERYGLEKEYLFHFQQVLNRLEEILDRQTVEVELKIFKNLFKKVAHSIRIPFSGNPVEGLQIMGVMETRNLDFKHVFMMNMNEGVFPTPQRSGSFIPYRIRKAFDLPTFELQDAIYAYLFYRILHHAEEVEFLYNMYADFGISGEISRFVHQLELESEVQVKHQKLTNLINIHEPQAIVVEKTAEVIDKLIYQYAGGGKSKLSASALNVYYQCKLQFYFKYALRKFSENQLNDELGPREFGNILHWTMEIIYRDVINKNPDKQILETDFFRLRSSVVGAIIKAFKKHFNVNDKRKFILKGRNIMIAEVLKKYVHRMLDLDERYAPFQIVSMEKDDDYLRMLPVKANGKSIELRLGADIDRVDKKNGVIRVIDYKSGRDTREIETIEKLFVPSSTLQHKNVRNKAGFQTMFYAWLYASKHGSSDIISPGLIGIRELFEDDFDYRLTMGGRVMDDARPYLQEFEEKITKLINELFSIDVPFTQTEQVQNCTFCDFKQICGK